MKWFKRTAQVGLGFCREAATDHSPGLQPWVRQIEICALKVAPDVRAIGGIHTTFPEHTPRSPLFLLRPYIPQNYGGQAGRFYAVPGPGLKPWAVLFTPFGRQDTAKTNS